MARRPTTPKVQAAARRNITKAQITRIRTRQPRKSRITRIRRK